MKFAIGYRQPEGNDSFDAILDAYRASLAEVYFSWPGLASGRPGCGPDFGAQRILEEDLAHARKLGLALDLLFNANCYGAHAVSRTFENEIRALIEYTGNLGLAPEIITTTSPFVAGTIKKYFPDIEVRASVNMRLDSTLAMGYLGDLFDSFHIRRDLQRDLETVRRFHRWCEKRGKKLCLLANSGCLRNCPAQTFHDNLVAHDHEIAATDNVPGCSPFLCRNLLRDPANHIEFLRGSWLRPEELALYEPYFSVVKLATRQHMNPRSVIGAYADGRFHGNMASLTEPGFGALYVDNAAFPESWRETARGCAADCRQCGKCDAAWACVSKGNDPLN